jgi:hypothetical protein
MIQAAMDFHRQGGLPEAERLYRNVLAQQPDQLEALHFPGGLELQQGDPSGKKRRVASRDIAQFGRYPSPCKSNEGK